MLASQLIRQRKYFHKFMPCYWHWVLDDKIQCKEEQKVLVYICTSNMRKWCQLAYIQTAIGKFIIICKVRRDARDSLFGVLLSKGIVDVRTRHGVKGMLCLLAIIPKVLVVELIKARISGIRTSKWEIINKVHAKGTWPVHGCLRRWLKLKRKPLLQGFHVNCGWRSICLWTGQKKLY